MGDSNSFSSLFALVDSHLSKSNIKEESQPRTNGLESFKLSTLDVQRNLTNTSLPSTSGSSSMRFPSLNLSPINNELSSQMAGICLQKKSEQERSDVKKISSPPPMSFCVPSLSLGEYPINKVGSRQISDIFQTHGSEEEETENSTIATSMGDCSINDVLAIQLSNMFKAREAKEEKRRQQELERRDENMEDSSCLIDLTPAIQVPGQIQKQIETVSNSSSLESIIIPDTLDNLEEKQPVVPHIEIPVRSVAPLKPIKTDMSYILKHKIGKCSEFGKVLCARYRRVAAPYFREYVPTSHIKVFDFSTPSPDDIILEKLRRPSFYSNRHDSLTVSD